MWPGASLHEALDDDLEKASSKGELGSNIHDFFHKTLLNNRF